MRSAKVITVSQVQPVQPCLFGAEAVKTALIHLGGRASKQEIVAELQRMNAPASLAKTFSRAINKLVDWREVQRVHENGNWFYIVEGYVPKVIVQEPIAKPNLQRINVYG